MTMETIKIANILDMAEERLKQADVLRASIAKPFIKEFYKADKLQEMAAMADELEQEADELLQYELDMEDVLRNI